MRSKQNSRKTHTEILTYPEFPWWIPEAQGVLLVCAVEVNGSILPSLYNLKTQITEEIDNGKSNMLEY